MHSRLSVLPLHFLILILVFRTLAVGPTPAQALQEKNEFHLKQFDLLTATSGWILLDQRLFWTSDAGQTWNEIGPSTPAGAAVQDGSFIDASTGWLLWTSIAPDGNVVFQLAHTLDHGATWSVRSLPLFEEGEIASYAEKAEMGWFDAQTGWISVKQSSGSNFSIGTLFRTSDGGATWQRFTLPVADQTSFSDPQVGWAIGGPAGDQVFMTKDAGATWQDFSPHDLPANTLATAFMPFYSGGAGLLVMTNPGLENTLRVYSLEAPADEWLPVDEVTLDAQAGVIGLSILDSRNFMATIPGTTSIVRMLDGDLDLIYNQDDRSSSIVALDMVSPDVGWAKSVESSCVSASRADDGTVSVSCSSTTRLLHTTDGGITWQSIRLPLVQSDMIARSFSGIAASLAINARSAAANTQAFIGQGFDKCEIPTVAQLQTWWNSSPYKTVNLYIGGSSRACDNSVLNSTYLAKLYQQGWKFIPTWVGPQAPCTGFRSRFSSDPTTAYNQGVNEANLAVERLAELGLTKPDKTGSVVYYDMEHYGTDGACRTAVNAFMDGWVSQIHARGNLAGVYASTLCNTGLSDFRNISNVPDVIWPARWYHGQGSGYYDASASVWNLGSCIPNTVWANHQRIRQYEGGHNETWGNLTLEIDSNVLDGVVALLNTSPSAADLISPKGNIGTNYNPTYTWNTVSEAIYYYLRIDGPSGTVFAQWYQASDICGSSVCSATPAKTLGAADYTWNVRAWNEGGYGPWSTGLSFTVMPPPTPDAANLISPDNATADPKPTYTWNEASGAQWYLLAVDAPSGPGYIQSWYSAAAICSSGTCSIQPSKALKAGDHTWMVRAWNTSGYGPWSSPMNFTLTKPGAATLVSPSGDTNNNKPTYTWNAVEGATWYLVWVDSPSGSGFVQSWWSANGAGCGDGTGTCSVTPGKTLPAGAHTWYIRPWSTVGYGPWSNGMNFIVSP